MTPQSSTRTSRITARTLPSLVKVLCLIFFLSSSSNLRCVFPSLTISPLSPIPHSVTSLTSSNNYINFCASQAGVPLTNGLQIKDGCVPLFLLVGPRCLAELFLSLLRSFRSCNQAPMGRIFSINRIPSCKFIFPKNLDAIQESTPFTIQLKIKFVLSFLRSSSPAAAKLTSAFILLPFQQQNEHRPVRQRSESLLRRSWSV